MLWSGPRRTADTECFFFLEICAYTCKRTLKMDPTMKVDVNPDAELVNNFLDKLCSDTGLDWKCNHNPQSRTWLFVCMTPDDVKISEWPWDCYLPSWGRIAIVTDNCFELRISRTRVGTLNLMGNAYNPVEFFGQISENKGMLDACNLIREIKISDLKKLAERSGLSFPQNLDVEQDAKVVEKITKKNIPSDNDPKYFQHRINLIVLAGYPMNDNATSLNSESPKLQWHYLTAGERLQDNPALQLETVFQEFKKAWNKLESEIYQQYPWQMVWDLLCNCVVLDGQIYQSYKELCETSARLNSFTACETYIKMIEAMIADKSRCILALQEYPIEGPAKLGVDSVKQKYGLTVTDRIDCTPPMAVLTKGFVVRDLTRHLVQKGIRNINLDRFIVLGLSDNEKSRDISMGIVAFHAKSQRNENEQEGLGKFLLRLVRMACIEMTHCPSEWFVLGDTNAEDARSMCEIRREMVGDDDLLPYTLCFSHPGSLSATSSKTRTPLQSQQLKAGTKVEAPKDVIFHLKQASSCPHTITEHLIPPHKETAGGGLPSNSWLSDHMGVCISY